MHVLCATLVGSVGFTYHYLVLLTANIFWTMQSLPVSLGPKHLSEARIFDQKRPPLPHEHFPFNDPTIFRYIYDGFGMAWRWDFSASTSRQPITRIRLGVLGPWDSVSNRSTFSTRFLLRATLPILSRPTFFSIVILQGIPWDAFHIPMVHTRPPLSPVHDLFICLAMIPFYDPVHISSPSRPSPRTSPRTLERFESTVCY